MAARSTTQAQVIARKSIASKVRALRQQRLWTQAQLAKQLGLSQARLSEIERGSGSFTAEQFLTILRLFNVPVAHFVVVPDAEPNAVLQNALARLGAAHLRETADASPAQAIDVHDVIIQTLTSGDPRLIAGLAPVLVDHIDRVNLHLLDTRLVSLGLERRLAWVVENTLDALRTARVPSTRARSQRYRRASLLLETFLSFVSARERISTARAPDVLDRDIRSRKTLDTVRAAASEISNRWLLATSIQPQDFRHALEAAHAVD